MIMVTLNKIDDMKKILLILLIFISISIYAQDAHITNRMTSSTIISTLNDNFRKINYWGNAYSDTISTFSLLKIDSIFQSYADQLGINLTSIIDYTKKGSIIRGYINTNFDNIIASSNYLINKNLIPTDSLIAFYNFYNGVFDYINGYNGKSNGATSFQDDMNYPNSAYYLSGTGNYISMDTISYHVNANSSFTVDFWFNRDSSNTGTLLSFCNSSGFNRVSLTFVNEYLYTLIYDDGVLTNWAKQYFAHMSDWYNIAFIYNGNDTISVFLNGNEIIKSHNLSPSQTASFYKFYLGRDVGLTTQNFKGYIDDLFVYNKKLSPSEITNLYNRYYNRNYLSFNGKTDLQIYKKNANITRSNQVNAVTYLYNALNDSDIYTKQKIIYPFLFAGSNNSIKYNLQSPVSSNDSFRIFFTGNYTNINDSLGLNGIGNTNFNLRDNFKNFNFHITYDVNDSLTNVNSASFGSDISTYNNLYFSPKAKYGADSIIWIRYQGNNFTIGNMGQLNPIGIWTLNCTDTTVAIFCDGLQIGIWYFSPDSLPDAPLYMHGKSSTSTDNKKGKYASVGDYLTNKQVYQESQIIKNYQNYLYRGDTISHRRSARDTFAIFPIPIDSLGYNASPDTTTNPNYHIWDGFSRGCMFSYQMRSYNSSFSDYAPSPYTIYGPDSIDVANDWIAHVDSFGVDYCIFTVMESQGWSWDIMPNFPKRFEEKAHMYDCYDSRANPFDDDSLTYKFVTACRAVGDTPVLYINPIRNLLFTPLINFTYQGFDSTDVIYYNNWFQRFSQDIIKRWNINFIWVDGWKYGVPTGDGKGFTDYLANGQNTKSFLFQQFYNAVKAANPNCLVIMNNWGDTTGARMPFDIASNEELVISAIGISDANLVKDHVAYGNYHMRWEYIENIAANSVTGLVESGFWYAQNDTGPQYVIAQSVAQNFYDRAKSVGAKWCLNIIPGRTGKVGENQWNIWRNMIW